ncbi:hypothetical protein [Bacillus sp. 105MF]|uniref:hypothetical protein n=1 Tax=Bacillus sp. 105MF TaxID=1151120 RepID=UPI0003662575|nr:hypothetical protein [Bacillus sp. 105MF]
MTVITIEDTYQELLLGKRMRFPQYTWENDTNNDLAKRVTKYLIENILKWNDEEIKKEWGQNIIKKYKLGGLLAIKYKTSPYAMLNDAYPERFKEWELNFVPTGFWTRETGLEALKWTIEEKEKLTDLHIRSIYSVNWLRKHGMRTPIEYYWNGSPYAMLNDLYPGKFKEWELNMAPLRFWTKEKALEALQWTIEEKEKLTDEQLLVVYELKWLSKQKLEVPCNMFWNASPYAMLNDLYPEKFKEWELNRTPLNFWTKEKALEALRWIIEEKEKLSSEQLKKVYSRKWLQQRRLAAPLEKYWNSSPHEMLNDLYPGQFTERELLYLPMNFWTKEKALETLQWTIEKKEQLTNEELKKVYSQNWVRKIGLGAPLKKFWGDSPYMMLDELYPNQFTIEMFRRNVRR